MEKAYEEVQLCLKHNQHNLSTETLQMCLDALRTVKETKHNGYTNYATWLAATFVDNNKVMYNFYVKLVKELQEEQENNAIGVIAQTLQYQFGAEARKYEEVTAKTIWSSLINDAECSINYWEIAKMIYETYL